MMTDYALVQSRCGLRCNECEWVEKASCPGCLNVHGKPFWGECVVAICCEGRGLLHCGRCEDFPCEKLMAFAYDSDHGDKGERIETLRKWLAEE